MPHFMKKLLTNHKLLVVSLAGLIVLGGAVKSVFLSDSRAKVQAQTELSQTYTFNNLTLTFTQASKQPEVLIKGKRAYARNEKTFLILDFNLTNTTSAPLFLNLEDRVRWIESEQVHIAPQVEQGDLEVRPQSTKRSNVGFVVPEGQKEFTIQVGELNGEKQTFEVEF